MKTNTKNSQAGFTLIEFTVTFVIAAIMASMFYTFFRTTITQSSEPIFRLKNASNLQKVMENIIADYERLNRINLRFKWRANATYKEGEFVLPSDSIVTKDSKIANNGRYYECTAATGDRKSGNVLPSWPAVVATTTTLGRTVTDNDLTWTERGYVRKVGQQYPASKIVLPAINNGHFYLGPESPNPFTPDATDEPTWPLTAATSVSDGSITWTEVGTILKSDDVSDNLFTLLPAVGDPILTSETDSSKIRYGKGYTVTEKSFIKFIDDTSSPPDQKETPADTTEKNILKVTIKNNASAETLTQIFTIR
jgi:prepilin-type N-terminal cleavage/methylation domain-containing protein